MESKVMQSLIIDKKCNEHQLEFVAICINSTCKKNGPVCYNCVFYDHKIHPNDCIPLGLWKFDLEERGTEHYDIDNNLEKVLVKMKDLDNFIQNYFSNMYEKIHTIKENYSKDGLVKFIGNYLPVWKNFKLIDNEYVITKSDAQKMLNNLEFSFMSDIEKFLVNEFKKLKIVSTSDKQEKKSAKRFKNINGNWSHSKSYFDCIGFKTNQEGVILVGVGLFEMDNPKKGLFEISIYQSSIDNSNLLIRDNINLAELNIVFTEKYGDFYFSKEILLEPEKKYVIVKLNLEDNGSGNYGKNQYEPCDPFVYIDIKEESKTYKSGNYTDLNTGAFPYFIYK